jgi:epoxyqueuosine reductase
MSGELLSTEIKMRALGEGFSLAGIIEAKPGRRLAAYQRWIGQGFHGQMGYMARPDRQARRNDLNVILSGVRSIVCVGLDYASMELPAEVKYDPSRGRISNYAWAKDYHKIMEPRLKALADWLTKESGTKVRHKVYVDTGAILERDHAETAGLGFTGKNTMLIHPRRGSWFFLGELLTTAALVPDKLSGVMPTCGSCTSCLSACPTNAFPEPYILDARRCISYLTIELKDWIPRELRPLMGNWVFGCDICQTVCPFNRFSRPTAEQDFWPASVDVAMPKLESLLTLTEEQFERRYSSSPIRRIKRARLIRNACIAAGNWGHVSLIQPLSILLEDPAPIVRGHAAWALGQIRGEQTGKHLENAFELETDPQVKSELEVAIANRTLGWKYDG